MPAKRVHRYAKGSLRISEIFLSYNLSGDKMDFWEVFTDVNFWMMVISEFQKFGPFGPIFLAASESLFSFLPFIAIVAFHVGIYGEIMGFVYSWIGTTIGSAAVFLIVRFFCDHCFFLRRLSLIERLRIAISKQDRLDLFLMTACAFMPSFFINLAYGFSDFDKSAFIKTILCSKAIMTATLVVFGSSIKKAMEEPLFFLLSCCIFLMLYMASKWIKKTLQVKTNE